MDIKNYIRKKASGLVVLAKVGGGFAVSYKKFNPETGEALNDDIVSVNVDELNKEKTELLNQIADVDAILADIIALN